jgi:membrane associated rhomboid family serine protease
VIPLPYRTEIAVQRRPVVVWTIVLLNAVVWLGQLQHGVDLSALDYGAIPAWVLHGQRDGTVTLGGHVYRLHQEVPEPLTIWTSMFLHAGWLHLIGNLWFLWVFGRAVEDRLGSWRFAALYLVGGTLAAMTQILAMPDSTGPMIGASGAIAAILGGYLVLYPRVPVRCLWILIIFITFIDLPSWFLLGLWLVGQFLIPSGSLVASAAHIGGFVAGALIVRALWMRHPQQPTVLRYAPS